MQSLRNLALAGATALALAPAMARGADLPVPPPMFRAPIVEEYGAWYLRGDIGITNQSVHKLDSPAFNSTVTVLEKGFESAGLFGLGIGYRFNNWLRLDATGEYRANSTFHGLDTFPNGGITATNQYTGVKSEWLFLFNAFLDLGTWHSVTPFVGAGVGFDRLTIGNFTDSNIQNQALGFSTDNSKWNFAWALHAGLAYQVTPNFIVELAYRYVDLGNGATHDLLAPDGSNPSFNPILFKHVTSNDLKLGVRWMFADTFFPEPPLIRKY
ncbi:MAG TPA: outer membrane protein [Xanthobacteraceae bacterium]|nr:outer membrane protein [Xanthobacteraceae bacterium]